MYHVTAQSVDERIITYIIFVMKEKPGAGHSGSGDRPVVRAPDRTHDRKIERAPVPAGAPGD